MPLDPLYLATAVESVVRAGELQLAQRGSHLKIGKKGTIDLVTDVDLRIEAQFREMIAKRFPHHRVLAEELGLSAPSAPSESGYCWLFDPIDGTTNYAHGLPIFCSALALELANQAIVAAVYDPSQRELFTAERGGGALRNGQPLRVSGPAALLDSLLCTGFPYDVHETLDEIIGLFGQFVGRARAVRRLGSAALDLCYVAAGRFDGFWEQRLQPWDIAAGALLVEEAGGRVTSFSGAPFDPRAGQIVASNGHVHDEMLSAIADFQAARARKRTP